MRLWHQKLIKKLPSCKDYKGCSNQLGGQHTEIRMIFGTIKKRGKLNHSTVNYVNNYSLSFLRAYGLLIINEMKQRGFNVSLDIIDEYLIDPYSRYIYKLAKYNNTIIYPEHNDEYYQECVDNLKNKGVIIK